MVNYPLLSDRTQEVSKKYGILNRETGGTYRATFIINPKGIIEAYSINLEPVGRNIDEILRLIAAFQFNIETGLAVPANWKPGDPGLITGWDYVGKY